MRFTFLVLGVMVVSFGGSSLLMDWIAPEDVPVQAKGGAPIKLRTEADLRRDEDQRWRIRSESERDQNLNELRRALIRAADTYAAGPCTPGVKQNLVEKVASYGTAFIKMTRFSQSGFEKATASFTTDLDRQVMEAIGAAFARGGITPNDFPGGFMLSGRVRLAVAIPDHPCGRTVAGK